MIPARLIVPMPRAKQIKQREVNFNRKPVLCAKEKPIKSVFIFDPLLTVCLRHFHKLRLAMDLKRKEIKCIRPLSNLFSLLAVVVLNRGWQEKRKCVCV